MNFTQLVKRIELQNEKIASQINQITENKLVIILIAVWSFWRILTLNFIEKSGDAVWKWRFLRYYAESGTWFPASPDHHQGRWAINLPVYMIMKIFGTEAWSYYIFPFFTSLVTCLLLYYLGRKLKSKASGVIVFLLALLFPLIARESNQFLPMLPAAMFLLAGLVVAINDFDSHKWYNMLICGILVGLSYGCKVTSMYWAASIGLFLIFFDYGGKVFFKLGPFKITREALLFSLGVACIFSAETLFINHFFGVKFGQFQVILGSHLSDRPEPEYMNLIQYLFSFIRPLDMSGKYFEFIPTLLIIGAGMGSAILLILKRRNDLCIKFISFTFIATYLFHSYVVYRFFPFLHPEKAHGRYHLILGAISLILLIISSNEWRELLRRRLSGKIAFLVSLSFYATLLIIMLIYAGNAWSHGNHLLALLNVNRILKQANSEKIPVFLQIEKTKNIVSVSNIASSDKKNGTLFLSFWGPLEMLSKERKYHMLFTTENGSVVEYLWGAPPVTETIKGAILTKYNAEIRSLSVHPFQFPAPH